MDTGLPKFNLLDVKGEITSEDEHGQAFFVPRLPTGEFDEEEDESTTVNRPISHLVVNESLFRKRDQSVSRSISLLSGESALDIEHDHENTGSAAFADVESCNDGTSQAGSSFKDLQYLANLARASQESQSSSWSVATVISTSRVEVMIFDMRNKHSIPVRGTKSDMFLKHLAKTEDEIKVRICESLSIQTSMVYVMSSFEDSGSGNMRNEMYDFRASKTSVHTGSMYYVFINPHYGKERHCQFLLEYKHTQFLKTDETALFCVSVLVTTSLRDLSKNLDITATRSDLHYFDKHFHKIRFDIPVGECKIRNFDTIIVLQRKYKLLQIGHHFRPGIFQLYTLKYWNTDTVLDLKKTFFEKFSDNVPSLKSEGDIYFSVDNEIMNDAICLSLKIDQELPEDSFESLDNEPSILVHFVSASSVLGLVVNHKTSRKYSGIIQKLVVIGRNSSTSELRKEISYILNCDELAVKILVNGKKVEETDCLSSIRDFSDGSQLAVDVVCKKVFKIKLVRQSSSESPVSEIECFKLNSVQNLRKIISQNHKINPSIIRMEFKGETMEDNMTLSHYNIKANQTIHAYVLDDQMRISVVAPDCPKRGTLFIDDGSRTKVEDVLTYFSVKIKTPFQSLRMISSHCCVAEYLTLKEAGIHFGSTVIITKCEVTSKVSTRSKIKVVYECTEGGNVLMKYGALIEGILFYVPEGGGRHISSLATPDGTDDYSSENLPKGIHWQKGIPVKIPKDRGTFKKPKAALKRTISAPKKSSQKKKNNIKGSMSDTETLQYNYMKKKFLGRAQKLFAHLPSKCNETPTEPLESQSEKTSLDFNDNVSVDFSIDAPLHHSTPDRIAANDTTASFNAQDGINNRNDSSVEKILQDLSEISIGKGKSPVYKRSHTVNDNLEQELLHYDICLEKLYKQGNKIMRKNIRVNETSVSHEHDLNSNRTAPETLMQVCTCHGGNHCIRHWETETCTQGLNDTLFLKELSFEVGKHWKDVAREFKIEETVLDNIDHEYHGLREKCYQMFLHWHKASGRVATKSRLAAALCQSNLRSVAEKFNLFDNLEYETT